MDDCIFCHIAQGGEASVVYEDAVAIAFMDIAPVTPGHLLVVPKRHVAHMDEMDEETGAHLMRVALRMNRAIRASGLRCEGVNLFLADGEAAGQEVFHVHLHVFPRFRGDDFKLDADWSARPPRAELDAAAAHIRAGWNTAGNAHTTRR